MKCFMAFSNKNGFLAPPLPVRVYIFLLAGEGSI